MLTKLCAAAVIALVLSPFTAPFRTFDPSPEPLSVSIGDQNVDLQIAPLVTQVGRLKIALLAGIASALPIATEPRVVFSVHALTPPAPPSGPPRLSTVLRV